MHTHSDLLEIEKQDGNTAKEAFEKIARKILFIINPLKKDIPITYCFDERRIDIGEWSDDDLPSNLNNEERLQFLNCISLLECRTKLSRLDLGWDGYEDYYCSLQAVSTEVVRTHIRLGFSKPGIKNFVVLIEPLDPQKIELWLKECAHFFNFVKDFSIKFTKSFPHLDFHIACNNAGLFKINFDRKINVKSLSLWFNQHFSDAPDVLSDQFKMYHVIIFSEKLPSPKMEESAVKKDQPTEQKTQVNNELYPVLVLGHQSAGSSTLVNYLMGCELVKGNDGEEKLHLREEQKPYTQINHTFSDTVTNECVFVENPSQKIVYCDSPGFINGGLLAIDSPHLNEKIMSQIKKTAEEKGAIIIVLSHPYLSGYKPDFIFILNQLEMLFKEVNKNLPAIRFVVTHRWDRTQEIYYARIVSELGKAFNQESAILQMMTKPENWLCLNMLLDDSRNQLTEWISIKRRVRDYTDKVPTAGLAQLNLHEENKPLVPVMDAIKFIPPRSPSRALGN